MSDDNARLLLEEVREVRKLLELLAEPAIAQRDSRLREELQKIVGSSAKKQRSVLLMDGSRTQSKIVDETLLDKSDLSKLVGKLESAGLLTDGKKEPRLAILVPSNFFDAHARTK